MSEQNKGGATQAGDGNLVRSQNSEGDEKNSGSGCGSSNGYLNVIKTLEERISELEEEIEQIESNMVEAHLLKIIPGASYYSALTIIAEIATVERFPAQTPCVRMRPGPSVSQSE